MAVNKVIYGGTTIIDLTADTVTAATMLTGTKAHDKSGAVITGTCAYDVNSADADAAVDEVLLNKTFYARGSKLTGRMPNNGAVNGSISTAAGIYTVPNGYHDGSGKVQIAAAEQAKIVGGNIKKGVTILGVAGEYEATACVAQAKEATPSTAQQIIQPDAGYTHLTQVTVKAIPYTESTNTAGGTTVAIG